MGLTVRGLNDDIRRKLQQMARQQKSSLNKIIVKILEESLGIAKQKGKEYHDLDHLAGTWSESEAKSFNNQMKAMRKIDKDMWK